MIPKIIHYCWVGGAPKPKSVLYCIDTWKKFCPDYEIIEWNESNYNFQKNQYMKDAYEAKKWGFVPDFARLDIVYEYGGIYLDTDVELIKSFDSLLNQKAFMGFENTGDGEYFVNCGQGFGAEPHHDIIKAARDLYDNISFYKDDGSLNLLASPYYTTQTLRQFGLIQENRKQELDNMVVYTSDVLCPKNFRSGVISITDNTVSIHHFTASWLDEKIKKDLKHQQDMRNKYGIKLGNFILYLESIKHKYSFIQILKLLPIKIYNEIKYRYILIKEAIPYYCHIFHAKVYQSGKDKPILFDTYLDSDNEGDRIIMENCEKHLSEIFNLQDFHRVPTHRILKHDEYDICLSSQYKILCGTNILSGHMRSYGLWKMSTDLRGYKNTILMGVGFDSNNPTFDNYSKKLFSTILDKKHIHSVRDSFSEQKLKDMGIKNVVNTGCPTMWSITPEHCKKIPKVKAKNVICTITDYNKDFNADKTLIDILIQSYENVYIWIQGENDKEYIDELYSNKLFTIIPSGLENYDHLLEQEKDLDYVGTRLHAGIRAITYGHRSLIISIDNRAKIISKDTGLPILERNDVSLYLKNRIESDFETQINMPLNKINLWKSQFKNID